MTADAAGLGRFGDRGDDTQPVQACVEPWQRAELPDARDLVEECAELPAEHVGHPVAYPAGVHRQPAAEIRVLGPDQHSPRTTDVAADVVGRDLEFTWAVQIECGRALGSEQLESQAVGQALRDARGRVGADRAVLEPRGEGDDILVLHRREFITHRALRVAVGDTERHGALTDQRGEHGSADLRDRTAHEFRQVDQVAADVGQGPGPGPAAVAPGDRRRRVERVVAPVAAVEVHEFAQRARGQFTPDMFDGRRPAVGVADGGDAVAALGRGHHRLGIGQRTGQRLFAQYVLARGDQSLDDLPMQMIGDNDAHRVDVRRIGDGAPVVLGALIAVTLGGVVGDGSVGIGDGDQPHIRPIGPEQCGRRPVSRGMRAAGHAATDYGDAY